MMQFCNSKMHENARMRRSIARNCRIASGLPPVFTHSGYDFWLQKLNQFNGNFVEAEMVKAFLTSIEYRARSGRN